MCRHCRNRIELSLLAVACSVYTAFGQATNVAAVGGKSLTLAQAQQAAFERNWDLLAAAAGIDAATAQKVVAREFPNPTFSFSSSKINVDNTPSSTPAGNSLWDRSYDTIFAINQLFEIGGKRGSRKASAQAGFEAARAQFLDAKRTLDLGVTRAYVTAAQSQENVRVLRQSAVTLREEVKIAQVRHNAGEISTADRSQIEITADRFELESKTAESAAAQARVALEVLIGLSNPKGDSVLVDGLEALLATSPSPRTNAGVTWRPDVVAAEAALRKAQADVHLQKAIRIPDPTVLAQYEHEPPDNPNSIGLGVSFPIPLWNRNRGSIMLAEAAREQARLAYEKIKAQAAAEIAIAQLAYEDARARWESYRDNIRPKSEQIRKTIAYAYEKGGASLLDLLSTQRNDNDVRLAATQAQSDILVAIAALNAASMEISPREFRK